jgi:mono/diheme cytochrome c family protein
MISPLMRRARELFLVSAASIPLVAVAAGCGTQKVSVPRSRPALYHGAVLFEQRCSGCHTLSYAATHGSARSVQSAEFNNGPNFNVRCERPIARVLYAIENGGFSGAIMPQNVVIGQDAIDVANFVATYAGRQSPKVPGVPACKQKPVGSIPAASTASTTSSTTTATTTTAAAPAKHKAKAKGRTTGKRKP